MTTVADPRRLAKAGAEEQRAFLIDAVLADPVNAAVLDRAYKLALPDHALMAGSLYKAVWNALTGRDPGYGVNDYDVAYFDASDLGFEAEDAVIRRCEPVFADLPAEVEVCNQARVHIWFSKKFGVKREPLADTADAVRHFASKTHAVALRWRAPGEMDVIAPFGLDELFSLRVEPMAGIANPDGWNQKIAEQAVLWPEIDFIQAESP